MNPYLAAARGYIDEVIDPEDTRKRIAVAQIPGQEELRQFVFDICHAEPNWNMKNFIEDQVERIREQVGDKKVLLALSGGVDSSVVAAMLIKAIGKQLVCVHVNHGLMRKNESESVVEVFKNQLHANLIYVDAVERFLSKLENVADPEQKRKIIGGEFIRVFEEEARKLEGIDFLGQGTIYPDIIESGTKTAKMVKSHHNVGGLPEDLQFELVEPIQNQGEKIFFQYLCSRTWIGVCHAGCAANIIWRFCLLPCHGMAANAAAKLFS